LTAFVLSKILLASNKDVAKDLGIENPLTDWHKLNNPAVQFKVLSALGADDFIDDVADGLGSMIPGVGGLVSHGLKWVGHKVGDWLGLTGEPRTLPVDQTIHVVTPNPVASMNTTPIMGPSVYSGAQLGNPHVYQIANPNDYNEDSVDVDYIATVLCPESGPSRHPGLGTPTAMAHAKRIYEMYTDQNGNGFMMFFPYAVAAPYGGFRKDSTNVN